MKERAKILERHNMSLDDWAAGGAERTDPETLWYELSEKDKKIGEMEQRLQEIEGVMASRTLPDGGSPETVELRQRVQELKGWSSWEAWPCEDKSVRKKASEHKMVQGLKELGNDKA